MSTAGDSVVPGVSPQSNNSPDEDPEIQNDEHRVAAGDSVVPGVSPQSNNSPHEDAEIQNDEHRVAAGDSVVPGVSPQSNNSPHEDPEIQNDEHRVAAGDSVVPADSPQYDHFPHKEIQNVLWIEGNDEHRVALKEWDRKEKYLSSKVDRKEKRSADLTNQIFNIVGFFSVFQGVVLTAVSQLKSDTTPLCGMVWVPALLSIVAALVAIFGVWIKFSTLEELETSIHNEKIPQTAVAARATKLRAYGKNFNFKLHAAEKPGRKPSSWISISISRICVVLSLFIFTGLFILAYVVILCNKLSVHKWNRHLIKSTS